MCSGAVAKGETLFVQSGVWVVLCVVGAMPGFMVCKTSLVASIVGSIRVDFAGIRRRLVTSMANACPV